MITNESPHKALKKDDLRRCAPQEDDSISHLIIKRNFLQIFYPKTEAKRIEELERLISKKESNDR